MSGAYAFLGFKGTSLWIYGARRNICGLFDVMLDGIPATSGDPVTANIDLFYQVLFFAVGLDPEWHTVSITNIPKDAREYMDIDSVSILILYLSVGRKRFNWHG